MLNCVIVEFRMVVFRPFVGEVLKGRIVSCNEEHIRGMYSEKTLLFDRWRLLTV
jgi:DNA-directed RNA polymerase subunit E'/Rpb7